MPLLSCIVASAVLLMGFCDGLNSQFETTPPLLNTRCFAKTTCPSAALTQPEDLNCVEFGRVLLTVVGTTSVVITLKTNDGAASFLPSRQTIGWAALGH